MRIKFGDIIIVLAIAAVIVLLLVLPNSKPAGSQTAVIIVDGAEYERIELSEISDPITIDLHESGVVIKAQDGQIWFASSTCPDQTCVNTGKLLRSGNIAVCLPNKVIVKIEGTTNSDIDVIAE
jgi:hypothetical protein